MEEESERVREENIQVFNIENIQVYNTWKKTNEGLRAYLFSSPMVVECNYGSLQSLFQALTESQMETFNLPSKLSQIYSTTSKQPTQNPSKYEWNEKYNERKWSEWVFESTKEP